MKRAAISFPLFFGIVFFGCAKGLNDPNRSAAEVDISFQNYAPSGMLRSRSMPQIPIAAELSMSTPPQGYREIPVLALDDESLYTKHTSTGRVCGTAEGSIESRIADCAEEWDGAVNTAGPAAKWKLVTRTADLDEVWLDSRTGLLWSDRLGAAATNFCNASGSNEDLSGIPGLANCSGIPGWCDSASMVRYRGNLTSGVYWRLPTNFDWLQAEIDGVRFVLPRMADLSTYWSSSFVDEVGSTRVRFFSGTTGSISNAVAAIEQHSVRCVGRYGAP
ncbi:MAG TPA: hypothetical protein VJB59_12450 [Bdellovibrionota bacterium]|nr:hypothetical protein [Bdellovibrionota bacterium]